MASASVSVGTAVDEGSVVRGVEEVKMLRVSGCWVSDGVLVGRGLNAKRDLGASWEVVVLRWSVRAFMAW